MNFEILVSTLFVVVILSAVVIVANHADRRRDVRLRLWVRGVLLLLNVALMAVYGLLPFADESGDIRDVEIVGGLLLALGFGMVSTAVLSQRVREWVARFFPTRAAAASALGASYPDVPEFSASRPAGEPLFPQMLNYYTTSAASGKRKQAVTPLPVARRGFDPRSMVHMVALVFCLYLLGSQFISFVQGGGLEGVAESFSEGLTAWDLVLNGLPLVIIPALGVGLGVRRTLPQALSRLGLGRLTLHGLGVGVGMTVALLILVSSVGWTWQLLVPPETFEEQTRASEALASSVTTIGLAFVLAASAAVSEEIAFRGALQPVFGFWPTAIFFALTHMQYALTPASLIIFGVAIAFGWIRARYNTSVAIVTHFLYNFIPLALNVAVGVEALRWTGGLGWWL